MFLEPSANKRNPKSFKIIRLTCIHSPHVALFNDHFTVGEGCNQGDFASTRLLVGVSSCLGVQVLDLALRNRSESGNGNESRAATKHRCCKRWEEKKHDVSHKQSMWLHTTENDQS